jgi:L-threonylcarbamoyladenylate synthase
MPVLDGCDPQALHQAARQLASGGLLGFPTETVYGLGARADDDAAAAAIFHAKGRPADHPLIVHVTGVEAARAFAAEWPAAAQALARHFWPGPLTVIVTRRPGVAAVAAGGLPTVGLRCPDHPLALALLREAQTAGVAGVAGPSANRFGRVSPTCAAHVVDEFGEGLLVLDGGPCREGIESTIVDCTRAVPALLRPGTLERAAIEAVLARELGLPLAGRDAQAPRVSGSLASHYAPRAPVNLADGEHLAAHLASHVAAWIGAGSQGPVGVYARLPWLGDGGTAVPIVFRSMPAEPARVAHELFAVLRRFDDEGVRAIWVEEPPPGPAWDGVRDRLQRAATR